ncbi:hypothetical protein DFA_02423 [Cavenderia fasciculata]|uniref:Cytosolic Fe-S cluster assembly factor NUBP1 homolog n=1 Tax=Cavenderia fasciculata TaxID=261658 RepID=F4PZE6_CACFS|nr:uncharacterized protein DFA_02423 [Cavenderia fasciculata]EGG19175.1 hypothetical protein DFA_02423 [Cavenderia fasciculata]|eukprot:XP_004366808.1 hypothetical protein DFA_02423 [Cavenderia fasciculata]
MTGCGGCSTKGSSGCCSTKSSSSTPTTTTNTTATVEKGGIRQYEFGAYSSNKIEYSNDATDSDNTTSSIPKKQSSGGGCSSGGCSSGSCKSSSTSTTTSVYNNNQQQQQQHNHSHSNSSHSHGSNQNDIITNEESIKIKEGTDDVLTASQGGCPSNTESAGKETVCQSCPGQGVCSSQSVNPDKKSIDIRMKVIKHKLLVLSGKGGVGKSSITSLLSFGLVHRQQKVSVLDIDICGPSIPKLMGVEGVAIVNSESGWVPPRPLPECNIHAGDIKVMSVGSMLGSQNNSIVWKGPRKTTIINRLLKDTFWGRQDYLVVDTPPGTGDEHLSIVSALSSTTNVVDGAIIVTSPQDLAVDTVKREIEFCLKQGVKVIGVIENLSGYACPCCDEVTEIWKPKDGTSSGGLGLAQLYNIPFLGRLPIDINLGYCSENGKCPFCDYPDSTGTKSFEKIIDSILIQLNQQQQKS